LAYEPVPPPPLEPHTDLAKAATDAGVRKAPTTTVPAISTDPALVAQLATRWAVEHLEAWAVAWACAQAGVPFAALLGIANEVGPDAHVQWKTHRARAEQAARDAAAAVLARH